MDMILDLSKDVDLLDLTKEAPSLNKLRAELSWKMHPIKGQEFDLDLFSFATTNDKLTVKTDVTFFNNKNSFDGGVVYPRDSRDGADVEEIFYTLNKIPAEKNKHELFVFIHLGAERQQDFSMVAGGQLSLYNDETGELVQAYKLQTFVGGTALHVGTVQRVNGGWGFQPVGESAAAGPNDVMKAFQ